MSTFYSFLIFISCIKNDNANGFIDLKLPLSLSIKAFSILFFSKFIRAQKLDKESSRFICVAILIKKKKKLEVRDLIRIKAFNINTSLKKQPNLLLFKISLYNNW